MEFDLKSYWQKALDFWGAQDKKRKIVYASIAGGAVALSVLIPVMLSGSGANVKLYAAGSLNTSEAPAVVGRLQSLGIDAALEDDGSVSVPKKDMPKATMQLSVAGFTKVPYSYDLFKGNTSLLSSESDKKNVLLWQTQARLEEAIGSLAGVRAAQVQIVPPTTSVYVLESDKQQATAAVSLKLDPLVQTLSPEQIEGIESLMAHSVPGLTPENVTVVGPDGVVLKSRSAAVHDPENDNFTLEQRYSAYVQASIMDILEDSFGKGNVRVSVKSSVDSDAVKVHDTAYTPVVGEDKGILQTKDEHTEARTLKKAEPTALSGIEGNAEVSTYQNQEEESETDSGTKQDLHEDYLVNKREQETIRSTPAVQAVSVAVTINRQTMTPQERADVSRAAAKTAGISEDEVVVINMAFPNVSGLDTSLTLREFFATPIGVVVLVLSVSVLGLAAAMATAFIRSRKKDAQLVAEPGDLARAAGLSKYVPEFPAVPAAETDLAQNLEALSDADNQGALGTSLFSTIQEARDLGADVRLASADLGEEATGEHGAAADLRPEHRESEDSPKEPSLLENVLEFVGENSEIASQFIRAWVKGEDEE
jgi:flagellar M-ring protein FliF